MLRLSCFNHGSPVVQVRTEEYKHYQEVKNERGGYYVRRLCALQKPGEYIRIIIDGADFFNYAIPYFSVKTHDNLFRAPVYVIGVIVHGIMSKCYIVPCKFKQGTNVILDVLLRVLADLKAAGHRIPRTLYLQLDNTSKQNKSRFMLGLLGYLLVNDVFDRILMSVLPVGHTHEDIDQLFSRLVVAIINRDARTIDELCTIIQTAYKDKNGNHTKTEVVRAVANFADWMDEYLCNFDGIASFRQFSFKWSHDKTEIVVRARVNTVDAEWRGIKNQTDCTPVFKEFNIPPV